MDVVCRCNSGATVENLVVYTGKSKQYVRDALIAALTLGMIQEECSNYYITVKECSAYLSDMPTVSTKTAVFCTWLLKFRPYILFLRYVASGATPKVAAQKVSSFFSFNRAIEGIEKLFVTWGKACNLLDLKHQVLISDFSPTDPLAENEMEANNSQDASIRLYLAQVLSPEVYAWLEQSEVNELVDSIKKRSLDPRSAIECAGRAFEDILRRIAVNEKLDTKKLNGITQVVNHLYSHRDAQGTQSSSIHSKQYNISQAIGDIRNMAGHSKEAKTLERWEISESGAISLVQLTITIIRSIYLYTIKGVFIF